MPAPYMSEAAKVRELPQVMKYITGRIADVGCGHDKITPEAIGFDGRAIEGVNVIGPGNTLKYLGANMEFDTIFSSHFLEHVPDPYSYISQWYNHLISGGHLVLYLPQKDAYNSHQNLEHMFNWSFDDFIFWFRRVFCGEGKDYIGRHNQKKFEIIDCDLDIGDDRYSFYIVARKI